MTFNIEKKAITNSLNFIIGAVEKKQTMSILGNVLLELIDNHLLLTATDMEIQCSVEEVCQSDGNLSVTVSGKKLFSICKNFPDGMIEFTLEDNFLKIEQGNIKYKLITQSAAEFPKIQLNVEEVRFPLNSKEFYELIQSCIFCMAFQDVRYYLNGMYLEYVDSKLSCVSTDGHRLAKSTLKGEIHLDQDFGCIIPRKGIIELSKILHSTEEQDVILFINKNQLLIKIGSITFISKLIDGRYPDYKKVIPLLNDKEISINKNEFKEKLSRISILTNENYHGVRLIFDNNLLQIQTNNPEQEFASEQLDIDYQHEEIDIGFNVNYLLDVLNHINGDSVILKMKNNSTSCLVIDPENPENIYVIMPMRL